MYTAADLRYTSSPGASPPPTIPIGSAPDTLCAGVSHSTGPLPAATAHSTAIAVHGAISSSGPASFEDELEGPWCTESTATGTAQLCGSTSGPASAKSFQEGALARSAAGRPESPSLHDSSRLLSDCSEEERQWSVEVEQRDGSVPGAFEEAVVSTGVMFLPQPEHGHTLESLHQVEPALLPLLQLTPPLQQLPGTLKPPAGVPPLVFACRQPAARRDADTVRLLLETGAPVDFRDRAPETALLAASRTGFGGGVEVLLENGADVSERDVSGLTPLLVACEGDHAEVVNLLLQAGADPEARRPQDGATAVMVAAHAAADGAVRVLIRDGVGVKDCARMGMTCMHFAALGGRARIARRLVLAGSAVDARCASGATPLIIAAEAGHARFVAALLRGGADAALRDHRGQSAADVALRKGNRRVLQLLWCAGAAMDWHPSVCE